MDYKNTIITPKTDFPMRAGLPQREPGMLEHWNKIDVYRLMLEKNEGKPAFILHDGPPFSNGDIHMGHALNKTLKEISAGDRTIMQLGISSIVMLPYVLLTENLAALEFTFAPVMLLLVAGIIHTGFAYTLYFGGIAGIPAQTAAVLSYIDPITAILLSVVLLREDMSAVSAIGCVLVIGAMLVSEIEPKKKRIPAAEQ